MGSRRFGAVLICLLSALASVAADKITNEAQAKVFLDELDREYVVEANAQMVQRWAYITNVTEANAAAQVAANIDYQKFQRAAWERVNEFDWSNFQDDATRREFQYLNILGTAALSDTDLERINQLAAEMETVYSTAKICDFHDATKCDLALEPELTEIMASSDDYDELEHVWREWRRVAGAPVRDQYVEFVGLNNKAAVLNSYENMGSLWNAYYTYDGYSEEQFKNEINDIWMQLKPLYEQLYTYVRRILATQVFPDQMQRYGRIPAHVLGNMWAQTWGNVARHVLPYNADPIDATPAMIEQGYTPDRMFEVAEKFFVDLGFERMTPTFNEKSMKEKPVDREVVCHASAEEFYFGPEPYLREDYRIKMCTAVNQEDLVTVHHEMGHIEYFMRYRNLHWVFRNGANPGFHEAIGDTLALAVSTPAHLEGLGLLTKNPDSPQPQPNFPGLPALPAGVSEQDLNYLMTQALEKVAFIPFGYLMDKWRWSVFDGTAMADLNGEWWRLRQELQGLRPPSNRSASDFDAGAKYHIPANVEYIRYFVSFVVQFQFYEAMCKEAGAVPAAPLYKCDFNANTAAGLKLMNMMDLGFSQPWPVALEQLTGTSQMNAQSLLNYFEPLRVWLEEANREARDCVGWGDACAEHARNYMENEYEPQLIALIQKSTLADWNYKTNITNENALLSTEASAERAAFQKEAWEQHLTQYEWELFPDKDLKRQFKLLQTLGTAALEDQDFIEMNEVIISMQNQYSTSKICPYNKPDCADSEKLTLEPDLEQILATSTNPDELDYVWKEWRAVASKPMREDFMKYVDLSNKAAVANGLADMSLLWMMPYETENFQNAMEAILEQIKPLYDTIHAYARMKLRQRYSDGRLDGDTPIPASLVGNMWAQDWGNLYSLLAPYPDETSIDVTEEMVRQNWTVLRMFQQSEEFYLSLGLEPMPTTYGPDSMIERPDDREVVCHASAWDFYNVTDYRIKMCTSIDMADLVTIYHEMGHIQYYIQYKDQRVTFRDGANPGFHEAIGDVMALSVSTPGHLEKIGLLPGFTPSEKQDMNYLMKLALEKLMFLPFSFVMDRWRYGVFSGEYKTDDWTRSWYNLTEKYQGLIPPVVRYGNDFDPGAKYHIASNVEYSRYFVAHVLQFQIHQALCKAADQFDPEDVNKPLYRCDIYQNPAAGNIMKNLLQAGSSRPWREILFEATGYDSMDATAILDFFRPLREYLDQQLTAAQEKKGWRSRYSEFIAGSTVGNNTIPIIVGSVLTVMVVGVVVAYFVGSSVRSKKKAQNSGGQVIDLDALETGLNDAGAETKPPVAVAAEAPPLRSSPVAEVEPVFAAEAVSAAAATVSIVVHEAESEPSSESETEAEAGQPAEPVHVEETVEPAAAAVTVVVHEAEPEVSVEVSQVEVGKPVETAEPATAAVHHAEPEVSADSATVAVHQADADSSSESETEAGEPAPPAATVVVVVHETEPEASASQDRAEPEKPAPEPVRSERLKSTSLDDDEPPSEMPPPPPPSDSRTDRD